MFCNVIIRMKEAVSIEGRYEMMFLIALSSFACLHMPITRGSKVTLACGQDNECQWKQKTGDGLLTPVTTGAQFLLRNIWDKQGSSLLQYTLLSNFKKWLRNTYRDKAGLEQMLVPSLTNTRGKLSTCWNGVDYRPLNTSHKRSA